MLQEPDFHFDVQTQREVLRDVEAARQWVAHLADQGLMGDPMRVVWLRILGELEEAEELGWKVLHRSGGPRSRTSDLSEPLPLTAVAAAVRLAHVLQWQRDFELAHALHEKALETIEAVEPCCEDSAYADYLRPFAYQHLARCYYDQGDYENALSTAKRALELRVNAGVPADHVLVTEAFISAVTAHLN